MRKRPNLGPSPLMELIRQRMKNSGRTIPVIRPGDDAIVFGSIDPAQDRDRPVDYSIPITAWRLAERPRPKPKRKKLKITYETVKVVIEEVRVKIELEEEDEGTCPTGCRLTGPPDSGPAAVAIELTTFTSETTQQSGSIAVPLGSESGPSSFGGIPFASAAGCMGY